MPIEIRELVIKATVKDEAADKKTSAVTAAKADAANEEQLVQRCVEQVMAILRLKDER